MEPNRIGDYRVVRRLGAGGMGEVYLVQHPRLPREDAIKLLSVALSSDPHFTTRFQREAEVLAGFQHPNIVRVFDRGESDGRLWLAMEYVKGADAAEALREGGPLRPEVVGDIVDGVGAALDAVWRERGVTHRDVKPANILLAYPNGVTPDRPTGVKLVDFGIAKAADESSALTATGAAMGTITYMAPEAIEGLQLDNRADLYSLACSAFEMLTGTPPYRVDGLRALVAAHVSAPIPDPAQRFPGVPATLAPVFRRALAKERDDRYSSGAEFAAAFRAALAAAPPSRPVPTQARPIAAPPPTAQVSVSAQGAKGGRGLWVALGGLVVVLLLAAAGYAWVSSGVQGGGGTAAPTTSRGPASSPAPTSSAPSKPTVTGTDEAGFVGGYARCNGDETLSAVMITEPSRGSGLPAHVVICTGPSGPVYRAAQVGDAVGISLQATPIAGGYTAVNPSPGGGGTTYRAVMDSGVTVTSPDGSSEFLRWAQIWRR